MNKADHLSNFLLQAVSDNLITANHICLFLGIYRCWYELNTNPIAVSRKKLMFYSKISSIATYHKCISDLDSLNYIRYEPSFHPKLGSKIFLP